MSVNVVPENLSSTCPDIPKPNVRYNHFTGSGFCFKVFIQWNVLYSAHEGVLVRYTTNLKSSSQELYSRACLDCQASQPIMESKPRKEPQVHVTN